MTSAAMTIDASSLPFAKSESKAVGMRGNVMDMVRANAPRIVGAIKIAGFIAMGFEKSAVMITAASLAIIGKLVAIGYGSKANQQQTARASDPEAAALASDDSIAGTIKKTMHPKAYPVESQTGFSIIADSLVLVHGISQLFAGGLSMNSVKSSMASLIYGVIGTGADVYMLFGKEKKATPAPQPEKQQPLQFAKSESKAQGILGGLRKKLKDNPVLTASLVNMCLGITMIVTGIIGKKYNMAAAAAILMTGDLVQAIFVKKNEFNIEGAQQEQQKKGPWSKVETSNSDTDRTFKTRLASQRRDSDSPDRQPA